MAKKYTYFKTREEAKEARTNKAKELFGDYVNACKKGRGEGGASAFPCHHYSLPLLAPYYYIYMGTILKKL